MFFSFKQAFSKAGVVLFCAVLCILITEGLFRIEADVFRAAAKFRNERQLRSGSDYTILCLGESTTAAPSVNDGISWPWHLSQILNRPGAALKFAVVNEGLPAANTQYIREHLEENLKRYRPHMVVTMMGINDRHILYYDAVPGSRSFLFRHSRLYRFACLSARGMIRRFAAMSGKGSGAGPAQVSAGLTHAQRGNRYYLERKYHEAEKELLKAIEIDPGRKANYIDLGLTYEMQLEFEKMRSVYERAVERFPHAAEGYIGLGWYAMQVGRFADAKENFKRALAIEPRRDDLWMGLARACRAQGEYGAAIEALHEAAASNPKNDGAYAALALIYEHDLQQPERAEEFARQASQARRTNINPVTAANYEAIYEALRSRGITMVCMQYPMRPLESLQAVFRPVPEDIVWVENRECFRDALRTRKYDELFIDMFGGDFGHCTSAGYRVIAENLAGVIEGRIRRSDTAQ